jgi:hypothetical protein
MKRPLSIGNNKSKKDKTKNANNHEGGVPSREQYR